MMKQGEDPRVGPANRAVLALGDTGEKLGQNRATGIMTRSPNDCTMVLLHRNMEIAVTQKYGSLRCKGSKLEAVSNFSEAHISLL